MSFSGKEGGKAPEDENKSSERKKQIEREIQEQRAEVERLIFEANKEHKSLSTKDSALWDARTSLLGACEEVAKICPPEDEKSFSEVASGYKKKVLDNYLNNQLPEIRRIIAVGNVQEVQNLTKALKTSNALVEKTLEAIKNRYTITGNQLAQKHANVEEKVVDKDEEENVHSIGELFESSKKAIRALSTVDDNTPPSSTKDLFIGGTLMILSASLIVVAGIVFWPTLAAAATSVAAAAPPAFGAAATYLGHTAVGSYLMSLGTQLSSLGANYLGGATAYVVGAKAGMLSQIFTQSPLLSLGVGLFGLKSGKEKAFDKKKESPDEQKQAKSVRGFQDLYKVSEWHARDLAKGGFVEEKALPPKNQNPFKNTHKKSKPFK